MDSDFRAYLDTPDLKPFARRRNYNFFLWAVCILLLCGVALASWISTCYVFNHPEIAGCYHFMQSVHKIEPLKRFDVTAAPQGKFFTAREMYNLCVTMGPGELEAKNDELLRNYLRNYTDLKTPVPYLYGNFLTSGVHELGNSDLFASGLVAVAASEDCPQVSIEHVYPTAPANMPRARQMILAAPAIHLEKTFNIATVIHVDRLENGRMLFTVVPLSYGEYAGKPGIGVFQTDPPLHINIDAGLPFVKAGDLQDSVKTLAFYQKNKGLIAKGKPIILPTPVVMRVAHVIPAAAPLTENPAPAVQKQKEIVAVNSPAPTEPAPVAQPVKKVAKAPVIVDPVVIAENTAPSPAVQESQPEALPAAPPAPVVAKAMPPEEEIVEEIPVTSKAVATVESKAEVKPVAIPEKKSVASMAPPPATLSVAPSMPAVKEEKIAISTIPPVSSASGVTKPPAPARQTIVSSQPLVRELPTPSMQSTPPVPVSKPKVLAASRPVSAPVKTIDAATLSTIPSVARAQAASKPVPQPVYGETSADASPDNVKLEPFLAAANASVAQPVLPRHPAVVSRGSSWRTYTPGAMPRGKLVAWQETSDLADTGVGGETTYLQGHFVVTATDGTRAVLRPAKDSSGQSWNSVRVVVEYPNGQIIPAEGTPVARGDQRPFQIMDVRRGGDCQVNIYAREVTIPSGGMASSDSKEYNRYGTVRGGGPSY